MRKSKFFWSAVGLLPVILFLSQWPATWLRLSSLDCAIATPVKKSEACKAGECHAVYRISTDQRHLLLGHVVRNHSVHSEKSGTEIFPISQVTTHQTETWPELFVYPVKGEASVLVDVKYPQSAVVSGFAGLRPRLCESRNVLSVPSVASTLSLLSHILLATYLLVICVSVRFSTQQHAGLLNGKVQSLRDRQEFLFLVGGIYFLSFVLGTHFFDALRSSTEGITLTLRGLASAAPLLPLIGMGSVSRKKMITLSGLAGALVYFALSHPRFYLHINLLTHTASFLALVYSKELLGSLVYLLAGVEILGRVIGYRIQDLPLINLYLMALGFYGVRLGWVQGAGLVLSQVRRAYESVVRDLHLSQMNRILSEKTTGQTSVENFYSRLELAIPQMPLASGCGRVALLLLFPGVPAVTICYDQNDRRLVKFSDGKVVGAVFARVLLYIESLWFTSVRQLRGEGFTRLDGSPSLVDAEYFCALPLMQGERAIGAIAFTRFKDADLDGVDSDLLKNDLKIKMTMLARQIESSLQNVVLASNQQSKLKLDQLLAEIDSNAIGSADATEFLNAMAEKIGMLSRARVLIFKRNESDGAIVETSSGFAKEELPLWNQKPLNLSTGTGNRMGPFVVAFNEGKSSYLRRVSEIFGQLHPLSVDILTSCRAGSIVTVPLSLPNPSRIIALVSRDSEEPLEPYWVTIIEDLRSALVSHTRVIEQREALDAFGRLTVRLIGDNTLRQELLRVAREPNLPSTVGTIKTSLLLVPDIIGSSVLANQTSTERAHRIGQFYDELQKAGLSLLGAYPRKAMGDSMILATDDHSRFEAVNLCENIAQFARVADEAARAIGCQGARLCVHYGEYFCGMVGTRSFAQIDVMGPEIDRVCKLESVVKTWTQSGKGARIALTSAAFDYLIQWKMLGATTMVASGTDSFVGCYYLFMTPEKFLLGEGGILSSASDEKCA